MNDANEFKVNKNTTIFSIKFKFPQILKSKLNLLTATWTLISPFGEPVKERTFRTTGLWFVLACFLLSFFVPEFQNKLLNDPLLFVYLGVVLLLWYVFTYVIWRISVNSDFTKIVNDSHFTQAPKMHNTQKTSMSTAQINNTLESQIVHLLTVLGEICRTGGFCGHLDGKPRDMYDKIFWNVDLGNPNCARHSVDIISSSKHTVYDTVDKITIVYNKTSQTFDYILKQAYTNQIVFSEMQIPNQKFIDNYLPDLVNSFENALKK